MSDFDKAKQGMSSVDLAKEEQERRRELWRQQQKARMQARLPKQKIAKDSEEQEKQELPQGRSPRAIAARLRAQRLQELKEKRSREQKKGGKIAEAKKKVEDVKKAGKLLKNIYRIVNGAAGVTLVGLILTVVVMNAQLIFGNLLKVKFIPGLSLPEIMIILFINILFVAVLLLIFLLICAIIGIFTI